MDKIKIQKWVISNSEPNPLELLQEEMRSQETYIKVNAIHQIPTVATVMGPESVRTELVPYLWTLMNEEDEVLFALAQELGKLSAFAPGSTFVPMLESLASLEETVVREQAVASLSKVADLLPDSEVISVLIPVVLKLAQADNFSSRISACSLFVSAFPRAGNEREKLWNKFVDLSHEDTPMVRRSAVKQMGKIAQTLEKQSLVTDLVPDLRQLAQDEQDQVRILCVETILEIASLLNKEENKLHTLPIVLLVGEDKSWRVRYHFAEMFPRVVKAFGKEITESSLIQTFSQLLRDTEADVKSIALDSLNEIYTSISIEKIMSFIFPNLETIISDYSLPPKVRKNAASALGNLSKALDKNLSLEKLLPSVVSLLKEETNYEIKINSLESLGNLAEVIGKDMVTQELLNLLKEQAKEAPQWRVRETVFKVVGELCKVLVRDSSFEEVFSSGDNSFQETFLQFLSDSVCQVRETGLKVLEELSSLMPSEWVSSALLPKLKAAFEENLSYLHRITLLWALSKVKLSSDELLPILTKASKDPVPNVRFVVCKVIGQHQDKQAFQG